jgi:hypothetical protein
LYFSQKGFSLWKIPLLMNQNSVFMPKKQQGGKVWKSSGEFFISKKILETFWFTHF